MRRPAFLGLKTNLQNYQSSDVWLGGLDRFHCFRVKVLASKWGCLYGIGVRKMVCRSGVYYGLIAEYCLGEVPSQEREQCGFEHFCWVWPSFKVTFREAISTVFPSKGLCMRAFRHIEDDFIFYTSKQTYVPDLTCLQTLVTILVTDTRHHPRHWLLCEYSSSPSTYINRRLGLLFRCRQHPLSSQ